MKKMNQGKLTDDVHTVNQKKQCKGTPGFTFQSVKIQADTQQPKLPPVITLTPLIDGACTQVPHLQLACEADSLCMHDAGQTPTRMYLQCVQPGAGCVLNHEQNLSSKACGLRVGADEGKVIACDNEKCQGE